EQRLLDGPAQDDDPGVEHPVRAVEAVRQVAQRHQLAAVRDLAGPARVPRLLLPSGPADIGRLVMPVRVDAVEAVARAGRRPIPGTRGCPFARSPGSWRPGGRSSAGPSRATPPAPFSASCSGPAPSCQPCPLPRSVLPREGLPASLPGGA